ncbi:hypothetical protein QA600_06630 [Natronococcus sp. A-GB1]|uniref:hypothetical protein n=1 Tax=Natronococcus sp. A-GB1 TaxID=3037648 RepID=UPI00241E8866|nr:hypothetical protein [Natronococcus sp. A-GB1]MDG5759013.1 hypothetical protein [Natronococcus sp. A-GB1]
MPSVSRRKILLAASCVCSAGIAGCTGSFRSPEREARLLEVELRNHTADYQSVLVIVEDDGEQVFDGITSLPPADEGSPTTRTVENLPEEPGVYNVYFNLARRPDDVEGEFWARAANTNADCRAYRIDVESDDVGEPLFGIYRADGC